MPELIYTPEATADVVPVAPLPSGYDESRRVAKGRGDCQVTFGFDRDGTDIPRFLVQLSYATSMYPTWDWIDIARFDHNETAPTGHDIYSEGIHIDVRTPSRRYVTLRPSHDPIPPDKGIVIRWCIDYFEAHSQYFIDVFEGQTTPTNAPGWPP